MVYVNVMDSPRETCEELALTETFKAASDAAAPMFNTVTVAVEAMGEPFSVHETSKLIAWPSIEAGMDTVWLNVVVSPGCITTPEVSKNLLPLLVIAMFSIGKEESFVMDTESCTLPPSAGKAPGVDVMFTEAAKAAEETTRHITPVNIAKSRFVSFIYVPS